MSSMKRLESESDKAYKLRLETEAEELEKLANVVEVMVDTHKQFNTDLVVAEDTRSGSFLIGPALQEMVKNLLTPYTTYAVIALSGLQKSHLEITKRGDVERTEFVNQVCKKYIAASSSENQPEIADPAPHEWEWYLYRPIQKIKDLTESLKLIHNINGKIRTELQNDNRLIKVAGIKMECTYKAICDHLTRAGKTVLE